MKIYTKTGDKGSTRLVDGSCVEKFNPRVEAYGTVDELNSQLGVLRHHLVSLQLNPVNSVLEIIQNKLFVIGSLLATEKEEIFKKLDQITDKDVTFLEQQIDLLTADLPELKNFILPYGHIASCHAHICRTVCRRAERRSAEISVHDDKLSFCLVYLNRLSDYLFTLARTINLHTKTPEVLWDKKLS